MKKQKREDIYLRLCCECRTIYVSDDKRCPNCQRQLWWRWLKRRRQKGER